MSNLIQMIDTNLVQSFINFVAIQLVAILIGHQIGNFAAHCYPEFLVNLIFSNNKFLKYIPGYTKKIELYHKLKNEKLSELLTTTESMQEKIDFAKSRFEYLTLEEQKAIEECENALIKSRFLILKAVVGESNMN